MVFSFFIFLIRKVLSFLGFRIVFVFWYKVVLFVELFFLFINRKVYCVSGVVKILIWLGRLVLVFILVYIFNVVFCEWCRLL